MSDRYQDFTHSAVGQLARRPARAARTRPCWSATPPALPWSTASSGWAAPAGSSSCCRDCSGGSASRRAPFPARRPAERGQHLQGLAVRRHRHHHHRRAGRPARLLPAAAAQPRSVRAGGRARNPPGADRRVGADRPACARGLHPIAGQGGGPWLDGAARVRRARRRDGGRQHAGVPAVAQVGVRLGAGGPGRHDGDRGPARSPTGCGRWRARWRS